MIVIDENNFVSQVVIVYCHYCIVYNVINYNCQWQIICYCGQYFLRQKVIFIIFCLLNCMKMSGNKCQYVNCGKSKKLFPNLRFYRFPNDERREIWIINSGK